VTHTHTHKHKHKHKRATIKDTPFCWKRFWSAYCDLSTNYTVLFSVFRNVQYHWRYMRYSQLCWKRCKLSKVLHRVDGQIFIDVEQDNRTSGFSVEHQGWSPLKMEAKQSSEISVTVYQSTRHKFSWNLNHRQLLQEPQISQQHMLVNLPNQTWDRSESR
jgi:hypothetical protein